MPAADDAARATWLTRVTHPVVVFVSLAGVRDLGAIVALVAHVIPVVIVVGPVGVSVLLIRIGDLGAVVELGRIQVMSCPGALVMRVRITTYVYSSGCDALRSTTVNV